MNKIFTTLLCLPLFIFSGCAKKPRENSPIDVAREAVKKSYCARLTGDANPFNNVFSHPYQATACPTTSPDGYTVVSTTLHLIEQIESVGRNCGTITLEMRLNEETNQLIGLPSYLLESSCTSDEMRESSFSICGVEARDLTKNASGYLVPNCYKTEINRTSGVIEVIFMNLGHGTYSSLSGKLYEVEKTTGLLDFEVGNATLERGSYTIQIQQANGWIHAQAYVPGLDEIISIDLAQGWITRFDDKIYLEAQEIAKAGRQQATINLFSSYSVATITNDIATIEEALGCTVSASELQSLISSLIEVEDYGETFLLMPDGQGSLACTYPVVLKDYVSSDSQIAPLADLFLFF